MTVVCDLLAFQSKDHGERGIARYVLNLALGLERTNPGLITHYLFHPELPLPDEVGPLIASGRMVPADQDNPLHRPSAGGIFLAGSLFEMHEPLDRVIPVWCRSPYWRTMAIVYDLIPARFSDVYLSDTSLRHRYLARTKALASCDHLLAISQATADDAIELLHLSPDQLTTIGAGADERFRPPTQEPSAVAAQLAESGTLPGLRPGYLLFPTGIEWRKNVERTVAAYASLPAELRAKHQLVLVASLDDYGHGVLAQLEAEHNLADDVLATDFVSDETLTRLYQGAEAVIFPSLYEGFGLPALEAMQCGAAVLCADTSSLKEVQTLPEGRFDPEVVSSIAEAMKRVLSDSSFRDHLRTQDLPPFTWDRAAELTAEAIRELETMVPATSRRPRLALMTPLPPQRSGIATYAYRLLDHLRAHCDVTVFVDDDAGQVEAPEGVDVQPLDRLDRIVQSGGAFDRTLYFIGNSTFHVEMLDVLRRHPGAVLCHDVRLTGLYSETHRLTPNRLVGHSVGATLAHHYPSRYRSSVEDDAVIFPETAQRFGILMSREVALLAQGVLVHSGHAASLLRIDAGIEAEVVYPIPCPEVVSFVDDGAVEHRDGAPIISSFGMIAPSKDPALLIRALAIIKHKVPDAILELVGEIEPSYYQELAAVAAAVGVASSVHFLGRLDDEQFLAAQERATVAVQLRAVSNGESSAAVGDLLALGVPTVVSDLGAMAEYPPGVVVTVPVNPDANQLAEVLSELLASVQERDCLAIAATDYARANGFEQAAEILAKTLFS
ncbi:MAG: glycosyltransferase [Actinomycetia bacterium]|nr:glycosyltransferase [Actinomycetes bacterium]